MSDYLQMAEEQTNYVCGLRENERKNPKLIKRTDRIVEATGLIDELAAIVECYAPYTETPVWLDWTTQPLVFETPSGAAVSNRYLVVSHSRVNNSSIIEYIDMRREFLRRKFRVELPFRVHGVVARYDAAEDALVLSCTRDLFFCWVSPSKGCYRVLYLPEAFVLIGVAYGGIYARDSGNQMVHITSLLTDRLVPCYDLRLSGNDGNNQQIVAAICRGEPTYGIRSWEGNVVPIDDGNVAIRIERGVHVAVATRPELLLAYLRRCSRTALADHWRYYASLESLAHGGAATGTPLPFVRMRTICHLLDDTWVCDECMKAVDTLVVHGDESVPLLNSDAIITRNEKHVSFQVEQSGVRVTVGNSVLSFFGST